MKSVLFLIHDLCHGGAEKVLVNLVNNMDSAAFDITVMTLFDVGINKQFLKPNIKYKSCFKHPIPGNSHYMKLLTPKQLYKWLIKDNYDIVVSYLEGPTARVVGGAPEETKVVSWIHSTLSNVKEFASSFRSRNEAKACYKRADMMVYVSENVMQAFQTHCKTNNNIVLYNTNESDYIIKKSLDTVNNFPVDIFNWCGVGKLVPLKGFDRMLRIQKRLLDQGYKVHFHALGNGEQEESLRDWCRENGIENNVTFWGYQTNPYKIVSKCNLYVCASYSEGFSTAATEALIVGTPVCTVEVSGMKEMLGYANEYGIITDNNENALFEAIKNLIDHTELLTHYKKVAKIRGRDFSTTETVKAVQKMFFNL